MASRLAAVVITPSQRNEPSIPTAARKGARMKGCRNWPRKMQPNDRPIARVIASGGTVLMIALWVSGAMKPAPKPLKAAKIPIVTTSLATP